MINYIYIALGCFIIALIALSQMGCTQTTLQTGDYKLCTTIKVQEDWCIMPDGELVNGTTTYSTKIPSVSVICISKKSDDIERTIQHELAHAWINATGMDQ